MIWANTRLYHSGLSSVVTCLNLSFLFTKIVIVPTILKVLGQKCSKLVLFIFNGIIAEIRALHYYYYYYYYYDYYYY